jgi:hypothetical protein
MYPGQRKDLTVPKVWLVFGWADQKRWFWMGSKKS